MQNFPGFDPEMARGKTVGLIVSHLTSEGMEADYSQTQEQLSVLKRYPFAKVFIIPTGMLNIPLLQSKPGLSLPRDRMSAAFDFTVRFLKAILPTLNQLKIPFEILPFESIKFEGIPLASVFTTNIQIEAWENAVKDAIEQDKVTEKTNFKKSMIEVEKRFRENRHQLGDDIRGAAKRKPKKGMNGQAGLKAEDSEEYVKNECVFNFELSEHNHQELKKEGRKKFDFLWYSGGLLNRALMNIEINMVPDTNRLSLIVYDKTSNALKHIPLSKDACAGNMKLLKISKPIVAPTLHSNISNISNKDESFNIEDSDTDDQSVEERARRVKPSQIFWKNGINPQITQGMVHNRIAALELKETEEKQRKTQSEKATEMEAWSSIKFNVKRKKLSQASLENVMGDEIMSQEEHSVTPGGDISEGGMSRHNSNSGRETLKASLSSSSGSRVPPKPAFFQPSKQEQARMISAAFVATVEGGGDEELASMVAREVTAKVTQPNQNKKQVRAEQFSAARTDGRGSSPASK